MTTQHAGQEGFIWFLGKVEEVSLDPLQLGRVRVRPFNEPTDNLETEELRWASLLLPTVSASSTGVGISPTGIMVGSIVFGFYVDGIEKQKPVVIGVLPLIPNMDFAQHGVNALARGENIIEKSLVGPEPKSAYNSKYPFNKTVTTIGGHAIELDDTPGAERIHVYHKSGSYEEINPDGRRVTKTVDDNYSVTVGDGKVYVKGNVDVEIGGNCTVTVGGNAILAAAKQVIITAGNEVTVKGTRINLN